MTYSGNKASNSEISNKETLYTNKKNLITASFTAQYLILDQVQSYSINSPFDGIVNILLPESNNGCIIPYYLKQDSFLIRTGENIIHRINKGDYLEWKNININNIAVVIYIPQHLITDLSEKFNENLERFNKGLLTKSDSRIALSLNQIIDLNTQGGQLLNLRMQSFIIDILVHQIEGLFAENEKHELISNKNHYDKIMLAKKFIEKDLTKNYSIPELAKLVGTNEQYLKKHFKQYFGKTILHYITDYKMNHAKELILTGDYRVSDVARLTGYKHSTHFTTAFKKYFGFIPNSLRYTFLMANEGTQQIITELESIIGML